MALAVVGVVTNNHSTSVGDNTIDAFGENTNKGGKINYTYDAAGNRISKTVTPYSGGTAGTPVTTWYVRDASGNVMGIYTGGGGSTAVNSGDVTLAEIPLYGSSRLGELKPNTDVQNITATTVTLSNGTVVTTSSFTRGQKVYELRVCAKITHTN